MPLSIARTGARSSWGRWRAPKEDVETVRGFFQGLRARGLGDPVPEFKARAASYQAPSRAIARQLASGVRADYADLPPSALACSPRRLPLSRSRGQRNRYYFDLMRQAFCSKAASLGYEVIDLDPDFFRYAAHAQRFEYTRDGHWNETGHASAETTRSTLSANTDHVAPRDCGRTTRSLNPTQTCPCRRSCV